MKGNIRTHVCAADVCARTHQPGRHTRRETKKAKTKRIAISEAASESTGDRNEEGALDVNNLIETLKAAGAVRGRDGEATVKNKKGGGKNRDSSAEAAAYACAPASKSSVAKGSEAAGGGTTKVHGRGNEDLGAEHTPSPPSVAQKKVVAAAAPEHTWARAATTNTGEWGVPGGMGDEHADDQHGMTETAPKCISSGPAASFDLKEDRSCAGGNVTAACGAVHLDANEATVAAGIGAREAAVAALDVQGLLGLHGALLHPAGDEDGVAAAAAEVDGGGGEEGLWAIGCERTEKGAERVAAVHAAGRMGAVQSGAAAAGVEGAERDASAEMVMRDSSEDVGGVATDGSGWGSCRDEGCGGAAIQRRTAGLVTAISRPNANAGRGDGCDDAAGRVRVVESVPRDSMMTPAQRPPPKPTRAPPPLPVTCIREADVGGPHRDAETGQGMWGHGGKGRSTGGGLSEEACLPVMSLAREGDSPEASRGVADIPAPDSCMIRSTEGVAPGFGAGSGGQVRDGEEREALGSRERAALEMEEAETERERQAMERDRAMMQQECERLLRLKETRGHGDSEHAVDGTGGLQEELTVWGEQQSKTAAGLEHKREHASDAQQTARRSLVQQFVGRWSRGGQAAGGGGHAITVGEGEGGEGLGAGVAWGAVGLITGVETIEMGSSAAGSEGRLWRGVGRGLMAAGLGKRRSSCPGCDTAVHTGLLGNARWCEYSQAYYCRACHVGETHVIIARVLQQWDLAPRPVSIPAAEFLRENYTQPLFSAAVDLSPAARERAGESLTRVLAARRRASLLRDYVVQCPNFPNSRCQAEDRVAAVTLPPGRSHLLADCDTFSLRDWVEVASGALLRFVASTAAPWASHVLER